MPERVQLVSQIKIEVDGTKIEKEVFISFAEVTVDQHAHLPSMFVIRLYDPELKLLDKGPFNLMSKVKISVSSDEEGAEQVLLINGEVTALEPHFGESMIAELLVRGYDISHQLYRETKSKTFLNIKDSDIAEQIAQSAKLQPEVDSTSIVYEHIYQHNQSDLSFLMQRAWRIGFECFVDEGKLIFRKPVNSGTGIELTWGEDLQTFYPRMTVAEQVESVTVKGWDPEQQKPIIGKAESGNLYPDIEESDDGKDWAAKVAGNSSITIVDQPVISQAEAELLASARLDEISGAFIEADGTAYRRPDIKAGKIVTLKHLGERFSGAYLVTRATHRYAPEGLTTNFSVRGARNGLLTEQLMLHKSRERWPSVVIGVVTNTDDPEDWGRVKVKYPWMSDDEESDWARVIGIGAGKEAGYYVIPDVDDEVLIAFEHGDFARPILLGGVWNGKAGIPPEAAGAAAGEKPLVRTWRSRKGHQITMFDNSDDKIEILTKGGIKILLDDTKDSVEIEADKDISIKAGSNMTVEAQGNLKMNARGNMDLQASGQVNIKGSIINLN